MRAFRVGRSGSRRWSWGSLNDHYATTEWAHRFADDLGADFVVAGALGHINADSRLGSWEQGRGLLASFVAGLS